MFKRNVYVVTAVLKVVKTKFCDIISQHLETAESQDTSVAH